MVKRSKHRRNEREMQKWKKEIVGETARTNMTQFVIRLVLEKLWWKVGPILQRSDVQRII